MAIHYEHVCLHVSMCVPAAESFLFIIYMQMSTVYEKEHVQNP